MTAETFSNRFNPIEYADDEPIHVFVSEGVERWVPERIWSRLVNLGRAYETHLLPLVPGGSEPRILNDNQVENLIDEIEFIG